LWTAYQNWQLLRSILGRCWRWRQRACFESSERKLRRRRETSWRDPSKTDAARASHPGRIARECLDLPFTAQGSEVCACESCIPKDGSFSRALCVKPATQSCCLRRTLWGGRNARVFQIAPKRVFELPPSNSPSRIAGSRLLCRNFQQSKQTHACTGGHFASLPNSLQ